MGLQRKTYNLHELRPCRAAEWEEGPDGKIVILVPKFRNKYLVQWVLPRLRSQHFRVKLDELGSAVWKQCDGTTTVSTMGEAVQKQFGEKAEPLYDRIGAFLRKLEKGDLVRISAPE